MSVSGENCSIKAMCKCTFAAEHVCKGKELMNAFA